MRVVAHGEKWCRPQPVSRKSVRAGAENGPSVFEKRFRLFGCGVVLLWIFLRVFDFALLPPAYNGLLITQPFCGLHSWDLADRAWAARSHLKYGLGYTRGLRTLVVGDPPPLILERVESRLRQFLGVSLRRATWLGPASGRASRRGIRRQKATVRGPNPFSRRPIGGFLRKESDLGLRLLDSGPIRLCPVCSGSGHV
jgi:hypothetical protein